MLTLVVARARNGAIGRNGTIPWSAPEDLAFFQRETTGGAVIMGRKTWESLPKRPLPRRLNIVVTRTAGEGDAIFVPMPRALETAFSAGHRRVYGIGGEGIYRALLPLADRLLITEVDLDITDADAFFPAFDLADWHLAGTISLRAEGPACVLHEYLRRR